MLSLLLLLADSWAQEAAPIRCPPQEFCERRPSHPACRDCSGCDETLLKGEDGVYGRHYRGCQTKTITGKTCQPWKSEDPINPPSDEIQEMIEANPEHFPENYCRNPDGEPTIWCYTSEKEQRWEFCAPLKDYKAEELKRQIASLEWEIKKRDKKIASHDGEIDQYKGMLIVTKREMMAPDFNKIKKCQHELPFRHRTGAWAGNSPYYGINKFKDCMLDEDWVLTKDRVTSCELPHNWCNHDGAQFVYSTDGKDCDGDGILDYYCEDSETGESGYISSVDGCSDTWPNGVCGEHAFDGSTASTWKKTHEHEGLKNSRSIGAAREREDSIESRFARLLAEKASERFSEEWDL